MNAGSLASVTDKHVGRKKSSMACIDSCSRRKGHETATDTMLSII